MYICVSRTRTSSGPAGCVALEGTVRSWALGAGRLGQQVPGSGSWLRTHPHAPSDQRVRFFSRTVSGVSVLAGESCLPWRLEAGGLTWNWEAPLRLSGWSGGRAPGRRMPASQARPQTRPSTPRLVQSEMSLLESRDSVGPGCIRVDVACACVVPTRGLFLCARGSICEPWVAVGSGALAWTDHQQDPLCWELTVETCWLKAGRCVQS